VALPRGPQRCFHLCGVRVIEAKTFGLGDHVREGKLGLAPLPSAVVEEVIELDLAMAAGLVEGDLAGLQKAD